MAEELLQEEGTAPLSQAERVIDTFVAPSKTFSDIRRDASWWLPFILLSLVSYALAFGISQKVTWSGLVENTIRTTPATAQKFSEMPPEALPKAKAFMEASFKIPFLLNPVTNFILIALFALGLWPTINFIFGGRARYWQVFSVITYAFLVGSLKSIIALIALYVGNTGETFTMDNMAGTNPGYFIDTPGPLKSLLTSLDIFTIWMMVVMAIGLAIVARTKRSSGYASVFGWWGLFVLVKVAWAAVSAH